MNIIERARVYAIAAHNAIRQRRKYTNEPYWHHAVAVSDLVARVGVGEEVVAAALLHDVVEDTQVTLADIEEEFGPRVAELVEMVTDVSQPSDGNREARKMIDRRHLAEADADGQTIKLADLIDNTSTIVQHDPAFAKVYMFEKTRLLEVLTKGDAGLRERAVRIVGDYYTSMMP